MSAETDIDEENMVDNDTRHAGVGYRPSVLTYNITVVQNVGGGRLLQDGICGWHSLYVLDQTRHS